jgi:hypothetical protein
MLTVILFVASLGLSILAHVMAGLRKDRLDPPLIPIPWIWVQIVAVVFCIVLAAHLVSLATGHPLKGRFMP